LGKKNEKKEKLKTHRLTYQCCWNVAPKYRNYNGNRIELIYGYG
jgi:hypothetical protein